MDDEFEHRLTDLVTGEIDRQLRERSDALDAMKSQMATVLREFEDMAWTAHTKRSWMKSVARASMDLAPTPTAVAIHPVTTTGNIALTPALSAARRAGRKKLPLQPAVSVQNPPTGDDARSPDGKLVFDKKLPRVAHMEKRADGLQSVLAAQHKQQMYERALVRCPQCRSNVFAPSTFDSSDPSAGAASPPTKSSAAAPQSQLELEFVYGAQTGGAGASVNNGNCAFYVATGELLWFTASLVVLYARERNAQRFFRAHSGAVTSAGVHPNQYIVASGQAGRQAPVLVWNAKDEPLGARFTRLGGHAVAVRAVSFSHDGKLVASLGGDLYNTICVHDWKEQSLLATARGHSFRVHTLAFNPFQACGRPEARRAKRPGQALSDDDACYTLVSCGVRHIRFWTLTRAEFAPLPNEEKADFAFHGSSFGSPARLRPPTPLDKVWRLEGNVPSFHGRLDVQDFTSLAFVDDSPPLYVYDERAKELVATSQNDHTLGRVVAGTAKGDLCVFYQPRRGPASDEAVVDALAKHARGESESEPAKWWEIPDEYSDAEINALVLEKVAYEPTARLVDVVPHDLDTGNRFKLSKQAQAEIDSVARLLTLKPNSATLHARLLELKYSGAVAHQDAATQVAFCRKNGLVLSCGADGRLLLWKCVLQRPVRVPGVNTQGLFTPLATGTFSEGSHQLVPVDHDTRVFQLPSSLPGEPSSGAGGTTSGATPKPTSLQWRDDGRAALVATSTNCLWELTIATGEWTLVFDASSGAVAACSCHPAKEEVATVSHDGNLTVWDLRRHGCKRRKHLGGCFSAGARAVCIEFHPFGDELAIGATNGELLVVGYEDFRVMVKKKIRGGGGGGGGTSSTADLQAPSAAAGGGGAPGVSQLKYCPNAKYLAVGARDTFVYIYDAADGYKKLHVCEGHSSAVTQLTWSVEGDVLQSNASDGELLHWSVAPGRGSSKQITDAFLVRDTEWDQWTCVFGWPTAGIWSSDLTSLVDIAAVCRTRAPQSGGGRSGAREDGDAFVTTSLSLSPSPSPPEREELLAVACKSSIRLFRWPAMRAAKSRAYAAHAAPIPSLCFSFNNAYLVSVGGDDGAIMQWKCVLGGAGSPSKPSPVARHRPQMVVDDSVAESASSASSASMASTMPSPPPSAAKNSPEKQSPRRHSRQYRERHEQQSIPNDEGDDNGGQAASHSDGDESGDDRDAGPIQQLSSSVPQQGPPAPPTSALFQARALHAFSAENPDELSFQKGEILRVVAQDSAEWWSGERCDGSRGIFPASYVEVVDEESVAVMSTPARADTDRGDRDTKNESDGATTETTPATEVTPASAAVADGFPQETSRDVHASLEGIDAGVGDPQQEQQLPPAQAQTPPDSLRQYAAAHRRLTAAAAAAGTENNNHALAGTDAPGDAESSNNK
ncbi:hypothetical protein PybrP1_012914, partial [[Pythium] brassicae (nom. inval.)]